MKKQTTDGFNVILWLGFLCQDRAQVWKTLLAVVLELQAVGGQGNGKLNLDEGKRKVVQGIWTSDGVQILLTSWDLFTVRIQCDHE